MVAGIEHNNPAQFDLARVADIIRTWAPDEPVAVMRRAALRSKAHAFQRRFCGQVSYAVKANPSPFVLRELVRAGITTFDVASVEEMRAVRKICPDARLHYHNPVRSPGEIAQAKEFGVMSWSVDRLSELDKLGDLPRQTQIAVRLSLGCGGGAYDFGSKFGAEPEVAWDLLKEIDARGMTPAITFHPGTQCGDPAAWTKYIEAASEISKRAGVQLASVNVGGGFPSESVPAGESLPAIFKAIQDAKSTCFPSSSPVFWCEPGRAMVSDATWLLLRVKARTDDTLYLNDGLYGALGEWRDMPIPGQRLLRDPEGQPRQGKPQPFTIFGPTCDSLDQLPAQWDLPDTTSEGDYIVVIGAGAYTTALVTSFNGYGTRRTVDLETATEVAGQC